MSKTNQGSVNQRLVVADKVRIEMVVGNTGIEKTKVDILKNQMGRQGFE